MVLKGEHWRITAITLNAFTDNCDTPVHTAEFHLFRGRLPVTAEGNIFFLENDAEGDAYVILADCPDYRRAKLDIQNFTGSIDAGTDKITIVPCKKGECEQACRRAYRERMGERRLVAMSNTWGDGNGFSRVSEEFVLKEIDKAAELGLDIVQIDDGWQLGNTADRTLRDERGRRFFEDDFWLLNQERFPHGMRYLCDYAAQKGITLGLWFAPDSRDHFARARRDLEILKKAYEEWSFRFFKLDMYWIESDADRDAFLGLLRGIYALGPDVEVQLDVTRNARVNYLCGREYGTVFVENRYTKTATYYPHRTLKNLWQLSRYIPSCRFQFELVNPALNRESYHSEDRFAPEHYDLDYLFASVMLSNPLFWMELQFLKEEGPLKRIIACWKEHREALSHADIAPIGEQPSGASLTGFSAGDYALVFREMTDRDTGLFEIEKSEVLLSNGEVEATETAAGLQIRFSKPGTYAFLKRIHD